MQPALCLENAAIAVGEVGAEALQVVLHRARNRQLQLLDRSGHHGLPIDAGQQAQTEVLPGIGPGRREQVAVVHQRTLAQVPAGHCGGQRRTAHQVGQAYRSPGQHAAASQHQSAFVAGSQNAAALMGVTQPGQQALVGRRQCPAGLVAGHHDDGWQRVTEQFRTGHPLHAARRQGPACHQHPRALPLAGGRGTVATLCQFRQHRCGGPQTAGVLQHGNFHQRRRCRPWQRGQGGERCIHGKLLKRRLGQQNPSGARACSEPVRAYGGKSAVAMKLVVSFDPLTTTVGPPSATLDS